ncbi:Zip-domain-containing protein [Backusella circina FSU 941]|nr:Zip-domain-containing protein [Backusella circina FSU 941]
MTMVMHIKNKWNAFYEVYIKRAALQSFDPKDRNYSFTPDEIKPIRKAVDYVVPNIPTLQELQQQHQAEQVALEGREEWAVKTAISQVGEWQTVQKPIVNQKKVDKKDTKEETASHHDQKPEFQDDDEEEEKNKLRGFKLKEKEFPADALFDEDKGEDKGEVVFKKQGWLGVLLSSSACVIGASIVFVDRYTHFSILDSRAFMAGSMALASGVLLFSSLSVLLPQAEKKLNSPALQYTFFFGGALFTLLLTKLIHRLMPDAIHTCDTTDTCQHEEEAPITQRNNNNNNNNSNNKGCDVEYGTIKSSESHFRFHHDDHGVSRHHPSSECVPVVHQHQPLPHHHHDDHHETVEQAVSNDPSHYYSIGIQTAIAICVHKFPEGLIMFVSSEASSSLGLSVCTAMSIHNLTEGFMIALPLYYATRSRSSAFIYAAVMGGLSQPLGALMGLYLVRHISKESEDYMFGLIFSGVIRADTHRHYVLLFFFLGIFLVGLSTILESF